MRGCIDHGRVVWTGARDSRHAHGFAECLEGSRSECIRRKGQREGSQVLDGLANCVDSRVAGCGGLFAHSLLNLKTQDLGVRPDHVLEFSISPELNRYTPPQTIALADRIRKSMEPLPGVRSASESEIPMLANSNTSSNITAQGYNAHEDEDMNVDQNWVGPNFLATMGVPLLNGREFSDADSGTSPKV